jgi:hypothetical protein
VIEGVGVETGGKGDSDDDEEEETLLAEANRTISLGRGETGVDHKEGEERVASPLDELGAGRKNLLGGGA